LIPRFLYSVLAHRSEANHLFSHLYGERDLLTNPTGLRRPSGRSYFTRSPSHRTAALAWRARLSARNPTGDARSAQQGTSYYSMYTARGIYSPLGS